MSSSTTAATAERRRAPKAGVRTTEFWLTLAATIASVAMPGVTPDLAVAAAAALAALYTGARTAAKRKHAAAAAHSGD